MTSKKIICGIAVLAIAAVAAVNVTKSNTRTTALTDIQLANVEALASGENSSIKCKWKRIDCSGFGTGDYEACLDNGDGHSCTCGATTRDC